MHRFGGLCKNPQHLKLLQRQGFIEFWHDREISPGVDWEEEIKKQLDIAHIILFLVSPDFISSDYCYGVELQRAMERYRAGEVRIIPIILRPVYWQAVNEIASCRNFWIIPCRKTLVLFLLKPL